MLHRQDKFELLVNLLILGIFIAVFGVIIASVFGWLRPTGTYVYVPPPGWHYVQFTPTPAQWR